MNRAENFNDELASVNPEANKWESLKNEEFSAKETESSFSPPQMDKKDKEQKIASARESVLNSFQSESPLETPQDSSELERVSDSPLLEKKRIDNEISLENRQEEKEILDTINPLLKGRQNILSDFQKRHSEELETFNRSREGKKAKQEEREKASKVSEMEDFRDQVKDFVHGINHESFVFTKGGQEALDEVFVCLNDKLQKKFKESLNNTIRENSIYSIQELTQEKDALLQESQRVFSGTISSELKQHIEKIYSNHSQTLRSEIYSYPTNQSKPNAFANHTGAALDDLPRLINLGYIAPDASLAKIVKKYDKVKTAYSDQFDAATSSFAISRATEKLKDAKDQIDFSKTINILQKEDESNKKTIKKTSKFLGDYDLEHMKEIVLEAQAKERQDQTNKGF